MSTSEEINEVYEGDIERRGRVVLNKCGPAPFFDGLVGMGIHGVLPEEFTEVCRAVERADYNPCPTRAKKGSR